MIRADETGHRASLKRQDLIVFEQRLKDAVAALFPFKSHSIHFPRKLSEGSASWSSRDKKLLLPLPDGQGGFLGIFTARGVESKGIPALTEAWPALSALISDNLLLYKRSLSDPVTGLFSRHYLLHCMEREIETLRDPIRTSPPVPGTATDPVAGSIARDAVRGSPDGLVPGEGELPWRAGLGTLVVRLAALRDVVREFGYQFADELMLALADALLGICPQQAIAARTGDSEFAVHLPAAGPKACRALAGKIVQGLRQVSIMHPLRREQVGIAASVGYTLYPQDVAGNLFVRPSPEQARLVLRKARLAAALADENLPVYPGRADMPSVMGFGRILLEGGCVLERLPLSRVLVSLGANMHAREGQRFSVWSSHFPATESGASQSGAPLAPLYKGEIVLMEVLDDVSQAEIIHLGEPTWNIEPGDHLLLLPEEQGSLARGKDTQARPDPETGLLRHGDFLAAWAEEREKTDSFALALIRLAPEKAAHDPDASAPPQSELTAAVEQEEASNQGETMLPEPPDGPQNHPGHFMAEAVRFCQEEFGADLLGGRYGLNSLIFFHPSPDIEALTKAYEKLSDNLEKRLGLHAAIGISTHPYLEFRKADALENSRKALEYALLLPKPHVGLLDSLALNISADKRFSQGDTFGAIKEYQFALLADEGNNMAWNSLGICLAGLSRHAEAEGHFARALECDPTDVMALYNLGYMHQSQGRADEARSRYRECLSLEPDHLYAMVRLGQLAENEGNTKAAREFYEKAALLPGGENLTYRHFARLCISEGNTDEAREHLHEALLHDPQDALSMAMLSGLYLDGGEDPEIAATFARQSVSLRPELKAGWLQLARAMEALGFERESREARLKAGGV